jgi:hypothetical protein
MEIENYLAQSKFRPARSFASKISWPKEFLTATTVDCPFGLQKQEMSGFHGERQESIPPGGPNHLVLAS